MSPLTALHDPALVELLDRAGVNVDLGLQLVPSDRLAARPFDPGMALVVLPAVGVDQAPLAGRNAHGADPAVLLTRMYPPDHPVTGMHGAATVNDISSQALASGTHVLPALEDIANAASPYGLTWLVERLRQPDGCPWDREQDHLSLRPHLLEETYEVYDELEHGSTPKLAEELGDLLLNIVLHAQYAAEDGVFDMADVQRGVMSKIVRRHPHVFGDVEATTAGEVTRNWESIKAAERAANAAANAQDGDASPVDRSMPAAFAGLSKSLPALAYADEMQGRAAALGYDWPDLEGVIDKVAEEASELLAANGAEERHEEYGDLLFVLVNMGRKLDIDPEAALRSASRKFASRFARVERLADDQGLQLKALGLDALDDLWQEAKREETIERLEGT
ncbi:MAG: nucleoside triphosphate pyrophosphohydrolase [Chloroflexota bacterium]